MFFSKGRQAVFFLVMVFVCAMSLVYPSWRHWYEMIFPPFFIVMAILALIAVIRPPESSTALYLGCSVSFR